MSKKYKIYAFIDSQNLNLGVKNDIYEYRVSTNRGDRIKWCDQKKKTELIKKKKFKNSDFKLKHKGWNIDFAKFYKYLTKVLHVEKAYIFIGNKPGNEGLYLRLQSIGYILVFKPTLKQNGVIKGNCDAELVLHTMIQYQNYDKAVIVSGDGDFYCLVNYLHSENKLKTLLIPNKFAFSSLLRSIDDFNPDIKFVNRLEKRLKLEKQKSRHKPGTQPLA